MGRHRNATADSKAQDVYFTRAHLGATAALDAPASSTSTGTKVAWGLGGAAIALAAAGIAAAVAVALTDSFTGLVLRR